MSPETKTRLTEAALIDLLTDVVEAASAATTEQDVLRVAAKRICIGTGWPVGHIYLPAEEFASKLILTEAVYVEDVDYDDSLWRDSDVLVSVTGTGGVSRAFDAEEPAWSSGDIVVDTDHLPASIAERFDACAVLALPIVGQEPVAVLEFIARDAAAPSDMIMDVMRHIGRQIGRTIDHLRAEAAWQESEDALRKSEERYRALAESSEVGVWHITEEGYTVYVNDTMCALLEIDGPEELAGRTFHDFFTEDSLTKIEQEHAKRKRGIASTYEAEIEGKHGRKRIVLISGAPVTTRSDAVPSFIATFIDITERVKAEEARRESEARFRTIFDQSAIGISMVSREGRIMEANSALCQMLGYDRSELHGTLLEELIHPADTTENMQRFDELIAGDRDRYQLENRYLHKDGNVVWTRVIVSLVRDRDTEGPPKFSISMVEDITERKQMEAELNEANHKLMEGREAERTRLARELHDGPIQDLQGMNFQLGTLAGNLSDGDKDRIQVTDIQTSLREVIQTLRTICGDLRPPTLAPFGLESAIRSHAGEFQENYSDLNVQLDLTYDGQLLAEPTRLALFRVYQQAMDNVVQHAQAEHVTVRFRFDDEEVVLEVEDDGRGFAVPRRWTTFARKGHLGLAGSAERASAIGGSLDVTSAPGEGTIVRVTAPRNKKQ